MSQKELFSYLAVSVRKYIEHQRAAGRYKRNSQWTLFSQVNRADFRWRILSEIVKVSRLQHKPAAVDRNTAEFSLKGNILIIQKYRTKIIWSVHSKDLSKNLAEELAAMADIGALRVIYHPDYIEKIMSFVPRFHEAHSEDRAGSRL